MMPERAAATTAERESSHAHRPALVLLVLLLATLASWILGRGHHQAIGAVNSAIIAIALFKVRLIVLDFMELRNAPLAIRIGIEVWLASLLGVLLGLYWF